MHIDQSNPSVQYIDSHMSNLICCVLFHRVFYFTDNHITISESIVKPLTTVNKYQIVLQHVFLYM